MKAVKLIVLAVLALAALSCSLLYAPMGGCYNPTDPKGEIPSIMLIPSVDGYVDDSPYTDFDSPILWINPSPPPVAVPIMRFDGGDFPKNVVSAELHLWVTTAPSPATDIHAHAILKDWDPATIDWLMVTNGTFFDSTTFSSVTVPDGVFDVYVVLEVTEIYERMIQAGNHGFYLETTSNAMNLHSSRGENPPKLVIKGYD